MSYRYLRLGKECPICGETIYYGLWVHVERCAKAKQEREDARKAIEAGGLLKKTICKRSQIQQSFAAHMRGDARPVDEFLAELECFG